ncbi:MAG: type II toxin-antitoxin system PemK/MazF family toxin [Chloroflexi bacterium]|nr:type II toxin-antitoxin system PemK/MazF family toxin [Chloroflexota bacterium]
MTRSCRRGELYYADLNPIKGHEQGGRRPVLIIQNDIGNQFSPTTIVAPLTTTFSARVYPTEVRVEAGVGGLPQVSSVLLNQIKAIDKERLEERIGQFSESVMQRVDDAIKISLGLFPL